MLLGLVDAGAGTAATPPGRSLHRAGQVVSWSGTLRAPDPLGCGEAVSLGCDTTPLTVVAPRGSWITVWVDGPQDYVRVSEGSAYVAGRGTHLGEATATGASAPSTTFQQLRSGTVVYQVGVSNVGASAAGPVTYRASAELAGKAFDRDGECFVGDSGVAALRAPDDGRRLSLSVRLVTAPPDAAAVRTTVIPALRETYARIDVTLRVSLDVMPLLPIDTYPYQQVARHYGGVRPPGVDVVHVISDNFAGGFGQCIGGIAYPEKAFSTGSLHYAPEGTVAVPTVTAAAVAAHEIGHLLGAQHQMANCVEALPQLAAKPAGDGSVGPCTVMFPAAAGLSETFSALEKATIRAYIRRYARNP